MYVFELLYLHYVILQYFHYYQSYTQYNLLALEEEARQDELESLLIEVVYKYGRQPVLSHHTHVEAHIFQVLFELRKLLHYEALQDLLIYTHSKLAHEIVNRQYLLNNGCECPEGLLLGQVVEELSSNEDHPTVVPYCWVSLDERDQELMQWLHQLVSQVFGELICGGPGNVLFYASEIIAGVLGYFS